MPGPRILFRVLARAELIAWTAAGLFFLTGRGPAGAWAAAATLAVALDRGAWLHMRVHERSGTAEVGPVCGGTCHV